MKINLVNHIGAVVNFPIKVSREDDNGSKCLMQTSRYHQSLTEVREMVKNSYDLEVNESHEILKIIQSARKALREVETDRFSRIDLSQSKEISKEMKSLLERIENLESSSKSPDFEAVMIRLFSSINSILAFSSNCFTKQFI